MLFNELKLQDVDYVNSITLVKDKIQFSRNYLHNVQNSNCGNLTCSYCGKQNLIIEDEGMIVNQHIKATIDHIIPLSKGSKFEDLSNITVACGTCNNKNKAMNKLNTAINNQFRFLKDKGWKIKFNNIYLDSVIGQRILVFRNANYKISIAICYQRSFIEIHFTKRS